MAEEAPNTPAGDGEGNAPEGEERMLPQSEVDKIVQKRLQREREKQPSAEELETLRSAQKRLEQIEEANASEIEKAQKAAEREKQRADEAEQRAETEIAKAQGALVRSAVTAAAMKAGAIESAEDVYALLDKDKVTVGDDGQVTGAEQAVTALLEAKPYLVGETRRPGPGDGGAHPPVPTGGNGDLDPEKAHQRDMQSWLLGGT